MESTDSQATDVRPRARRGRRRVAVVGVGAAAVVAVGSAFGLSGVSSQAATQKAPSSTTTAYGGPGRGYGFPGYAGGYGTSGGYGTPDGTGGFGGYGGYGGSDTTTSTTEATAAQEKGIVDIDVVLGGTERAAGTGMILTPDGEILTNRHVVEGETSISVTVTATGKTYAAKVVGMSTTTDVAVVQLVDASGLDTVTPSDDDVALGDTVTGVGNAGGTGGTPSAATGSVIALNRSITASDTDGSNAEQLTGLIETDADIQAGDSGGALLDADHEVVGMNTAASAQGNDGYAIPIDTALAVAERIEDGASGTEAGSGATATDTQRAYLGVQVQDGADGGAQVLATVEGSPAAAAGLVAGDTITAVAGQSIASAQALSSVMASLSAGKRVTLTWLDEDGTTHSARVTPTTPAG